MTYRKKWLCITLGLLVLSSLAICMAGLNLLYTFTYKAANEQQDLLCENLISRVEKEMTALSGMVDFLCGKETTAYFTSLVALLPEEKATPLKEAFETYLREADIDTQLIRAVAFVGENENQATYLYETASKKERPMAIPSMDMWTRSGLAELLLRDGNLAYLQAEDMDTLLEGPYFITYPEKKDVVRPWLEQIQGQLCLIQLRERYGVILVLDRQVFSQYGEAYPWDGDGAAIRTSNGAVVWETADWVTESRREDHRVLLESSRTIGDSSWTLYYARTFQTRPYGLYILVLFGATVTLLVVVLWVVDRRVKRLLYPFDRFTDRIRRSIDSDTFETVSLEDILLDRSRPLYQGIFRLFIAGLLVPVICLGGISTILLNRGLRPRLDELARMQTVSLQGALKSNLEISERLLRLISGKPDFVEAASQNINSQPDSGDYREQALELNSYVNRYPLGMYNVAYLVLLDLEGNAKYQSLYLNEESAKNQLSRFTLLSQPDALAQLRNLKEDTGLLLCENIYGQSAVAVVKKLYDKQGVLAGYLQMMCNQSYFQEIRIRQPALFLVTQQIDQRLVFNSGTDDFYRAFLKMDRSSREIPSVKIVGRSYLVDVQPVESSGWTLAVFQRTDDLMSQSTVALLQNLILIGVLLLLLSALSLLLAHWMSQPLRAIEQDLSRVIENGCCGFVSYHKKDELYQLVETYNQVIGQLNSLMDSMVEKKMIEQRLANLQTQAELESLRQQIASHFFRNTLENIHMQVQMGNRDNACRMIVALSNLFSYGMNNRDRIELDKEIQYVENYIFIQRFRLHNAFEIHWEVDEDCRLLIVPKLILQPLVENCLTHGLYEYQSGGLITIRIYRLDHALHMEIEDNGVGIPKEELEKIRAYLQSADDSEADCQSSGLALRNISLRLRMYGGRQAGLTIDSRPMHGTAVHIVLPVV